MHEEPLRKEVVRHTIEDAVDELQRDDPMAQTAACEALEIGTAEWAACRDRLIEELSDAEDWIEREDAIVRSDVTAPPIDSDTGPEFLPSHPTLALVQSAMDEQLDTAPRGDFHSRDPKWLAVLYQRLRAKARGKAPFVAHNRLDDFRLSLPMHGSVALVSDWGTANAHARAIATEIARRNPHHVIHLGDVYYAGTPREAEARSKSQYLRAVNTRSFASATMASASLRKLCLESLRRHTVREKRRRAHPGSASGSALRHG